MNGKAILAAALLAVAMLAGGQAPSADAATTDKITPAKGKAENSAVIHGSGFAGGNVEVKFGRTDATNVTVPNDKNIKVDVPNKHPLDAQTVTVSVKVNNVEVPGSLTFEYDPPGQPPVIVPPPVPAGAPAATPFVVTFTGTNFVGPSGRMPNAVYAVSETNVVQGAVAGPPADTTFDALFGAGLPPGDYEFVVGFTDSSGASVGGFVVN